MTDARQIAFDILTAVNQRRYPLDHWLEVMSPKIDRLTRADRSLLHALVFGVLRWQINLDHIIDQLADKPHKIDDRVRIILRLALFQMVHMDRIPHSAAVNTAVQIAKQNRVKWASGFVNGLLRRASRMGGQVTRPDPSKHPARALSIDHAIPLWLASRWLERWGVDETRQLCGAINRVPDITLRTNTLKTDRNTLKAAVTSEAEQVRDTARSPEGVVISKPINPIGQWEAFQKGWFQVQDEAAQLVTHLLSPEPDHNVWDVCAGLGTKTAHIVQLMQNRGKVLATDLQAAKLTKLTQEMQRLGVTIVSTQVIDATKPMQYNEWPAFDRILVDAPCSGLGVLQKNPDGKWRHAPEDLVQFHQRQLTLIDQIACHLRPGGIMVYSVCSFEPEENEAVVNAFLQKHPEFAIHLPDTTLDETLGDTLTPNGWIRTLPHRHGIDGFFAAALIRRT